MPRLLAVAIIACACSTRPGPAPTAPAPSSGPPSSVPPPGPPDPAPPNPPPADPTLLDPYARAILAASPDGERVLVSNQDLPECICCGSSNAVDLQIATVGAGTTSLGVKAHTAWFSPDGRFITTTEDICVGMVDHPWIARADGTGLRALQSPGQYRFAGPWLYSTDAQGVYRQRDLDDDAQLVVRSASSTGIRWYPSPDGEAIAYCESSDTGGCRIESPVGAAPVAIPGVIDLYDPWTPHGSWLLSSPCTVYDRASSSVWSCDSTSLAQPLRTFADDAIFAFVTAAADGFAIHVRTIATGDEVVLPLLPWLPTFTVTPDHSTVIATPKPFALPVDQGEVVLAASAGGGEWTTLVDDVNSLRIEAFDSIAIMNSRSKGLLASIAGGPAHPVGPPGTLRTSYLWVWFEPPGGLDKILFWGVDDKGAWQSWIGNAKGVADWVPLSQGLDCSGWIGHGARCDRRTGEILIVRDDGKAVQQIAGPPRYWQVSPRRSFYIDIWSPGLHVVDNPWP